MGQLSLSDLESFGQAAVRALVWINDECKGEVEKGIDQFLTDAAAANGDLVASKAVLPGGLRTGTRGVGGRNAWWDTEIWMEEESNLRNRATVWCLVVGHRDEFSVEIRLSGLVGGCPLTVIVEGDQRKKTRPLELLEQARLRRSVKEFPNARPMSRTLDAYSRHIVVLVDPNWSSTYLRDSVMAQIAEWCFRVEGLPQARFPELSVDASEWWRVRANRVARRYADKEASLGELFEVAKRSVRPGRAAGQRLYWKKSLTRHEEGLVDWAAMEVGISRRTAFRRLKAGGKVSADFGDIADPTEAVRALADYLKQQEPKGRLSPEQRKLVAIMEGFGVKRGSARKLERRIRNLPGAERERRVRAAMKRAGSDDT